MSRGRRGRVRTRKSPPRGWPPTPMPVAAAAGGRSRGVAPDRPPAGRRAHPVFRPPDGRHRPGCRPALAPLEVQPRLHAAARRGRLHRGGHARERRPDRTIRGPAGRVVANGSGEGTDSYPRGIPPALFPTGDLDHQIVLCIDAHFIDTVSRKEHAGRLRGRVPGEVERVATRTSTPWTGVPRPRVGGEVPAAPAYGNGYVASMVNTPVRSAQFYDVPPAGFEPATHGLGNRCSIP